MSTFSHVTHLVSFQVLNVQFKKKFKMNFDLNYLSLDPLKDLLSLYHILEIHTLTNKSFLIHYLKAHIALNNFVLYQQRYEAISHYVFLF